MICLLDTSSDLEKCSEELGLPVGQLLTPLTRFRNRGYGRFAIDNGAFAGLDVAAFRSLVQREEPNRDLWSYLFERGISIPARTGCKWCFDQTLAEWRRLWRDDRAAFTKAVEWEQKTGHTFRSPSRDTQPAQLVQLGAKFEAGYIPRGDTDQMALFDAPELRKCRACSL